MKISKIVLSLLTIFCLAGWGPFSFFSHTNHLPVDSAEWLTEEMNAINKQASNIDQAVLKLSLIAYIRAHQRGMDSKQLLTIVDYSKPSSERRLWVVDLKHEKVLFNTWVTHGKNSGNMTATSFSNQPGSLKSSIGVFVTVDAPYVGSNGYSLRLAGLEQGINDNAYQRDIVVHGAWYADPAVAKKYGGLGRSWGCLAVSDKLARPLINTIKDRTLVFVYYPDRKWLNKSAFLIG
jgi:L,D-transpeptidase-like protein